MRVSQRASAHSVDATFTSLQTLTIKDNPDRTYLKLAQLGVKTDLTITVGSGSPIVLPATSVESLSVLLGSDGVAITSAITITSIQDTSISILCSHPKDVSIV
jgi:hypothetical protein